MGHRDDPYAYLQPKRHSAGPILVVAIALGLVVLAAGVGKYWLEEQANPDALPLATGPDAVPVPLTAADSIPAEEIPPLDLPALDASDAVVRDLVAGLSAHPQVAKWLVSDTLVRRFVAGVVSLSEGSSPARHVRFLEPAGRFRVQESEGRMFVDPASYRRYDVLAETFVSLDTRGTARLYRQLMPLFDEAYRDMGIPDAPFGDALARAMGNLLRARVPEQAPELVHGVLVYEFADADMEARTPAEKHVLRLGPTNARRVQAKLRELAAALGIEPH
jgi:hypothetical protein